jgi:hypothetical protein
VLGVFGLVLWSILNIKNIFSIFYRPQSQSQTEKFNCTLIDMLSRFVQEKSQSWTKYLSNILFAILVQKMLLIF